MTVQYDTFKNYVLPALELEGIERLTFHDLTKEQREFIEEYFDEQIFPVLTPVAIDAYRPFPMLLNKSLNLATILYDEKQARGRKSYEVRNCPSAFITGAFHIFTE